MQILLVITNKINWRQATNIFFKNQLNNFISIKTPTLVGYGGDFNPETGQVATRYLVGMISALVESTHIEPARRA